MKYSATRTLFSFLALPVTTSHVINEDGWLTPPKRSAHIWETPCSSWYSVWAQHSRSPLRSQKGLAIPTMLLTCYPLSRRYVPTNNALLINFPLSSDGETFFLISTDRARKSAPNVQRCACNVHVIQRSFHFACHRWWLGRKVHGSSITISEHKESLNGKLLSNLSLFFWRVKAAVAGLNFPLFFPPVSQLSLVSLFA